VLVYTKTFAIVSPISLSVKSNTSVRPEQLSMEEPVKALPGGFHEQTTGQSAESLRKEDHQDEDESRDSKFKTIWDTEMGDLRNATGISYRKAYVLLLSWHEKDDDLNTSGEVSNNGTHCLFSLIKLGHCSRKCFP
jgi:hypothetical protein